MLVLLKDPSTVTLIENVKLEQGYLPTVGDFQPVWIQDGLPQIEPALWFKADVVSCVLVDVCHRLITWSTQPITAEHVEHFRTCNPEGIVDAIDLLDTQSKLDRETYDLDSSYDEMFEAAEYLLSLKQSLQEAASLPKRKRKKSSIPDEGTINKIMVKLLHCYLIPCLKIKPEDLDLVENCLKTQEELIKQIDKDLEKKMNDIANVRNALRIKRRTMVDSFQKFEDVLTYPKEFLLLFESQFQDDIHHLNDELNAVQDDVNSLKEKHDAEGLKKKRMERDEVIGRQVKLLMARENIVNAVALERPRSKASSFKSYYVRDEGEFVICDLGKYDMQSALGLYAKVHEVLQNEREERSLLITKKNLLLSVREAIRETMICLQDGEITTGSSNNKTRSRRATDVLSSSVPDQWLTLSEKINECFSSQTEHLTRHVNFLKKVSDKLLAAVSVAKLAYRETTDTVMRLQRRRRSHFLVRREFQSMMTFSKDVHREVRHEVATLLRSRADSCKNFRKRMDSIIQMNDDTEKIKDDENEVIQQQIANEIRMLQTQIHAHFDMMSSELQITLNESSEVSYFKIWLCYEVHFYETVMNDIIKLYQLSYKLVCSNLKRSAAFVTFQELGVQEAWLLELLAEKVDVPDVAEVADVNDVQISVSEDMQRNSFLSNVTSSSSGSDLDNLNSLVKRLSVYQDSPLRNSLPRKMNSLDQCELLTIRNKSRSSGHSPSLSPNHSPSASRRSIPASPSPLANQNSPISASLSPLTNQSSPIPVNRPPSANQNPSLSASNSPSTNQSLTSQSPELLTSQHALFEYSQSPLDSVEELDENSDEDVSNPKLRRKNHTLPYNMKPPSRTPAYRSDAFKQAFSEPIRIILSVLDQETPLNKLQLMTKCVRQIQKSVTDLLKSKKQDGQIEIIDDDDETLMCCDDFLTILTLILLHLDPKTLSVLYPHVVMLTDFMAPFLTSGLHSNSLTHFYGAFQIIFSTMVIKHTVSTNMV